MMNDDEGTYLYAAWRTGLGEIPYRDFTVVQTPLALAATGALFRLTGPSLFAARALSLLCVLGAAVLLYRIARFRLRLSAGLALAAAGIFLLNKHVFFLARSFMPDNLMLLCAAAALGAMLRAESGGGRVLRSASAPQRHWRGGVAVSPRQTNEKNVSLAGTGIPPRQCRSVAGAERRARLQKGRPSWPGCSPGWPRWPSLMARSCLLDMGRIWGSAFSGGKRGAPPGPTPGVPRPGSGWASGCRSGSCWRWCRRPSATPWAFMPRAGRRRGIRLLS